jgi:D-3-phosphoglycerate dehydrogenase
LQALPRLVITEGEGFPRAALQTLRTAADVEIADVEPMGLPLAIIDADGLWVRLRYRIDAEAIRAAPRLKFIATPTTGLNHIDLDAARARNVEVVSLRGEREFLQDIRATAEHTIGLTLALLRNTPEALKHVHRGGWDRDQFRGRDLFERTVGVVGHGRLGRIVSRYLVALGANVLTYDPAVPPAETEPGVIWVELEDLLGVSEIVTLHVDLRPDTHGVFGNRFFARMRPGTYFINTSRGELIDESALLESLKDGHLCGAALDVLSGEDPLGMGHHPLIEWSRKHPNLLITPHVGGNTVDSLAKVETWLAQRVRDRCIAICSNARDQE